MICASIFFGHDSSMSVMVNGEFVCLIEFEKINGIKHYEPSAIRSKGRKIWRDTLLATLEVLKRDYGIKNSFDLLLHKGFCPTDPGSGLLEIVQDVLNVKQNSSMDQVQHHRLHCKTTDDINRGRMRWARMRVKERKRTRLTVMMMTRLMTRMTRQPRRANRRTILYRFWGTRLWSP